MLPDEGILGCATGPAQPCNPGEPAALERQTKGTSPMPRTRLSPLPLLAAVVVAACTPLPDRPPQGEVTMPPGATQTARDPMRVAITEAAYAFASPEHLEGRPAEAARAVAQYEFLAAELPYSGRWRGMGGIVGPNLVVGLEELRSTVGIAPDAPAQQVVDSLLTASAALQAGDRAAAERALSSPAFTAGGAGTLQRLQSLPAMPKVSLATNRASSEMDRQFRRDD